MVLSAQFWPPFKDNNLELPAKVTEHLDVYTKAFETYKVGTFTYTSVNLLYKNFSFDD